MRYWFLLIALWAWSIDYHHVYDQDPSGIHFIRQTDGLSFAAYYFHHSDFFNPGTYNLNSENGQVACEFPLFYYLTSKVYEQTGIYFPILRWFHGLISLLGLIFLYKLFKIFTNNVWLILGSSLFLLSSVVFGYYAFNFLPDAPAMALVVAGWYYGFNGHLKDNKGDFLWAAFFFGFAGLIKPTFFIHGLAFSLALMYEMIIKKNNIGFSKLLLFFLPLTAMALGIVSWNGFVIQYNAAHHDDYFLITTRPIWKMDAESIRIVWDHVQHYWHRDYFARDVWKAFYVMLALTLLRWRHIPSLLRSAWIFLFLGCLSYFILFFGQFRDHDYYALNIFPFFILLILTFISSFVEKINVPWVKWMFVLIILYVGISGWKTNNDKMRYRWVENDTYYAGVAKQLKDGASWTSNIPKEEAVAVIPDRTRNGSLLFCDHKGYTIFDSTQVGQIEKLRSQNLKWLIVLDSQYLELPLIKNHWSLLQSDTTHQRFILGNPF